ncbi:sugar ABC transporter ATP-binding protein [Yersinia pseudotuberculosis]|uniref:sugar ABC transporter ATP-binding protein n=1 Tax=Yersinia pseudotuberculosis TaxID=633 RepID=UPI0005E3C7DF|nr:sugar ABC transporter ATP-binding protein [Yersinia pseudotuberculosis]AXY34177.1 sugar ABC transporter ATP-binding protein [Yersinia pseudotuberculosis]AYX09848.1 sugar ABC transporter ATP-binding protein [Yersinia pseudotuberculosis]MBO1564589.1 ATP-binding cassette domain-containing protein [Yersinia pseudotuberculosis]MBO1588077.1 ATP-binding cassette domain-containing protein [Yersinia pseudotuberculosis]MBO1601373.1 ATP-binding cassette domain-containing protein [Yersinia pseudotuberc
MIRNEILAKKPDYLLEATGLKKSFGDVIALNNAEFCLKRGSIHALCGGNGAGKSTFLGLLMGFIQPDDGAFFINGQYCEFDSPGQALAAGITIVQQELSGVQDLSVAENIYLGSEPRRFGIVDFRALNRQADVLLHELGFAISPKAKMRSLSVAEQQRVEIAKALSHTHADIIIMDEPTSALGEEDAQKLFQTIKKLASLGKGVIYVSHRLSEIFQIADSYTVFRDGCYICEGEMSHITREQLIEHIIGGEIDGEFSKYNTPTNVPLFKASGICWKSKVNDVSLTLHCGEILGIYGLVGSGRSEFLNLLFGLERTDHGSIHIGDEILLKHTPEKAINAGIAYVTEDRQETGLVLNHSVSENINISSLNVISRMSIINENDIQRRADHTIRIFNIKTPSRQQRVANLSGGNQQKVVLGRWALLDPKVLLLDEPTRGIDIGAKKEIYRFMSDFALKGKGIVMVSSELSEIIGMSDRILVFKKGKIVGEIMGSEATQAKLMSMAV